MRQEVLRAFQLALDPTSVQVEALTRHAGAARWAFNHALGMKVAAHQQWRREVQAFVEQGVPEAEARKRVRVPVPSKPQIQKHLNQIKGDSRVGGLSAGAFGPERPCPWWHEVNTYAFQSAFIDADRAWKNWLDSLRGARAGRRVGYPRFKKKGRAREAFRLHHDVKRPSIRLDSYRRLLLPRIGSVRLHESAKRLGRLIGRGEAVVQSVTVSRAGHRWYASVLCKVTTELPEQPTRRQRQHGRVGVDLGVKHLAVLSQPLQPDTPATAFVTNPRHVRKAEHRLAKAQRALARTQKGSARRDKARRQAARLHHEVAVRRSTVLHALTKTVSYMASWSLVRLWGVGGGDGSFRMAYGRSPGHCCRRRRCVRRAVGSRTSMTKRCSPRSSMCWSVAVPGGRCRRASGRRSRPCAVGFSSGPGLVCGDDCTRRCSNSWTVKA